MVVGLDGAQQTELDQRGPVNITFCAAWEPPRSGRRTPVDKGPCRQRGQSGSISTSPGSRGGNTDLGLSIAAPPWGRRESGCDFAKATASIRRISRTMQSF